MKNYIVTIEDIYRQEANLRAENAAEASKIVRKTAQEMLVGRERSDDFCETNFYLREADEPGEKSQLLGSVVVRSIPVGTDEDEDVCALCEEDDCDNCPYDEVEDDLEDELDDPEDSISCADILDYFNFISLQLENLTSLLEKVCKAIPKE